MNITETDSYTENQIFIYKYKKKNVSPNMCSYVDQTLTQSGISLSLS
jgi:hypothetical protein